MLHIGKYQFELASDQTLVVNPGEIHFEILKYAQVKHAQIHIDSERFGIPEPTEIWSSGCQTFGSRDSRKCSRKTYGMLKRVNAQLPEIWQWENRWDANGNRISWSNPELRLHIWGWFSNNWEDPEMWKYLMAEPTAQICHTATCWSVSEVEGRCYAGKGHQYLGNAQTNSADRQRFGREIIPGTYDAQTKAEMHRLEDAEYTHWEIADKLGLVNAKQVCEVLRGIYTNQY